MQLLPDEDHEMRLNGDQQNSSTFAQMHFGRNLNCPDQLTIRRRTQVPHGLLESQATKGQYPSSDWGIRVKTTLTEVGSVKVNDKRTFKKGPSEQYSVDLHDSRGGSERAHATRDQKCHHRRGSDGTGCRQLWLNHALLHRGGYYDNAIYLNFLAHGNAEI
ncbi:hypothetical protein BGZ61DRAFT_472124 [Ilyonectria robusta]|uniref:uncharacterized protein n=1 Tax=Ilyonectria robusta TaxID=1079257 RepID=UPI001E8ECBB8|nr:uncharacterized protein BGZ61DRAFT_472124 [Ilyonectria robusta]KAH8735720.1 hypothetical protein BGZ61DRAFT_472124 [Ilyonectria robusta]